MLDVKLAHRKVLRISGRERNSDHHRCRGNQAVCLCESDSSGRMIATPPAGKLAFRATELDHFEPVKQSICSQLLAGSQPSMDLLDIDRGGARNARALLQRSQPANRAGPTAEQVDQDRRIQENWHRSADALSVCRALSSHPPLRVDVPFMLDVSQSTDRAFDVVPAAVIVQRAPHGGGDERAPPTSAHALIEIPHDLVVEANV